MSLPIIDEEGNKRWYTNGGLHREGDPPAFVSVNVTVSAPIFCVLVSSWIHNCKCR